MRIVILEDDPDQVDLLVAWLEDAGHQCDSYADGNDFVRAYKRDSYDLALLDWVVPSLSGLEVLTHLKEHLDPLIPVVFITQRDAEQDIVQALEAGADDYMTKPVRHLETMARVNAIARRMGFGDKNTSDHYDFSPFEIDTRLRQISLNGMHVEMTQKELAKKAGVSHDTISKTERILKVANEETKQALRSGNMSVNQAYRDIKRDDSRVARVEKINEISQGNEELSLDKTYPVIYADPPWQYQHSETDSRKIENHYPTMSLDDICNMPVSKLAAADSILFLWTTSPKLEEGLRVLNSWGFKYTTCAIWDKQKKGLGYYFRQNHEILLIGKRGGIPTPEPKDRPDSIISIPKGKHSAKPFEFHKIIENMYPDFSKIELFCREAQPGWDVWGNQSDS